MNLGPLPELLFSTDVKLCNLEFGSMNLLPAVEFGVQVLVSL